MAAAHPTSEETIDFSAKGMPMVKPACGINQRKIAPTTPPPKITHAADAASALSVAMRFARNLTTRVEERRNEQETHSREEQPQPAWMLPPVGDGSEDSLRLALTASFLGTPSTGEASAATTKAHVTMRTVTIHPDGTRQARTEECTLTTPEAIAAAATLFENARTHAPPAGAAAASAAGSD